MRLAWPVKNAHLRRAFAWTAFPVVMSATIAWAVIAMQRGWSPSAAIAGPTAAGFLFILVAERFFPYHERWLGSHGDVSVDASFAAVDLVLDRFIQLLVVPGAAAAGSWLALRFGLDLWPTSWPLIPQLILALVFAELFKYWGHRWMHEWEWLWRFHATHHSVPRLYWLNASRFHPVDLGIDTTLGVASLVIAGCGPDVIGLFLLVTAVHGGFQHCNLEIRLGPLNWFFSMAELHRWHHSRLVAEGNNNYGNNVIVWDVVFGTRYLPADREPPLDIGLTGLPAFPTSFAGQLLSPLNWRAIKAAQ